MLEGSGSWCDQIKGIAVTQLPINKVLIYVENTQDLQNLLACAIDREVCVRMAQISYLSVDICSYPYLPYPTGLADDITTPSSLHNHEDRYGMYDGVLRTITCLCNLCPQVRIFWLTLTTLGDYEDFERFIPNDKNPLSPLCALSHMEEFRYINPIGGETINKVLVKGLQQLASLKSLTRVGLMMINDRKGLFETLAVMKHVVQLEIAVEIRDLSNFVVVTKDGIVAPEDSLWTSEEKIVFGPLAQMPNLRYLTMLITYNHVDLHKVTMTRITKDGFLTLSLKFKKDDGPFFVWKDIIPIGSLPNLTYLEINGKTLMMDAANNVQPMLNKPGFLCKEFEVLYLRDRAMWDALI